MSNYRQLKVKIENAETLTFYYAYNERSTFDDLLEFIAYYFPKLNLCPCFKFKAYFSDTKQIMEMDGNWSFKNVVDKYTNYELYNPNKECKCVDVIKDNFTKSKIQIIQNITKNLEINNNKNNIKIDENTGKLICNNQLILNKDTIFENFYDIIVDIKSIKDICKGWPIKMSKKAKENYDKLKSDKVIRIGVIGNANKGKSFILSKISEIELPTGTSIKTEGLSIKYPELEKYKERKIVLLDSAGLETPVLNENDKNENNENDIFKEKSREKIITELFLQNYIINNSDLLLIVVGILTYSEQKLLNRIKLQLKNSKIKTNVFVIHNLMTLTKMEQIKEYIDNVLLKSVTFKLDVGHKIAVSTEQKKGIYFTEKNEDKNNDIRIYHCIMANEGSEAGDFCNEFVKNQINNFFVVAKDEPFDVIETIKDRFIDMSKEMFEKIEKPNKDEIEKPLTKDDFEKIEKDNKENPIIKLKKEDLVLKKCLIDELGFSNLRTNGFMPLYNYYKKDNNIVVRVEAPGNCDLSSKTHYSGEYVILRIEGNKKQDKEPAKLEDNIRYNREFGVFTLDIYLKNDEHLLKNEDPDIDCNKGVFILKYQLEEKKTGKKYTPKKDEEDI